MSPRRENPARDHAEVDRIKTNFLAIVSHELRTPLNFITGFASILEDEVAGPLNAQQREYIGKILTGADRLLDMVNDLLDMNRMLAGRFALELLPVDFRALMHELVESLRLDAGRKQLALEMAIEESVLELAWLDPLRIAQVIRHLLSNAVKFTPDCGRIQVRSFVEPARDGVPPFLVTQVNDTGYGVDPEDVPALFMAFQQLDMSATREAGGMGLGLPISKEIVEAHGGRIGVISEKGQGSTFWFAVPLREAGPEGAEGLGT